MLSTQGFVKHVNRHKVQYSRTNHVTFLNVKTKNLPIDDDRLLVLSIIARLLGLFNSDRLANDISAVTRVIVILQDNTDPVSVTQII